MKKNVLFLLVVGLFIIISSVHAPAQDIRCIDNGLIKVCIDLDWGGAIVEVSHQGFNLISNPDPGREIQGALYTSEDGGDPQGWNPVQAGNKVGMGTGSLGFSRGNYSYGGKSWDYMHTHCRPLFWNPNYDDGLADLYIHQKVSVASDWPLIRVQYDIENWGEGDKAAWRQELPCVYVVNHCKHLYMPTGGTPWQNGPISHIIPPDTYGPNGEHYGPIRLTSTEHWGHYAIDTITKFGLTLYKETDLRTESDFYVGHVNTQDSPQAYYIGADEVLSIESTPSITSADAWIIVGNLQDTRNVVYYIHNLLN